MFIDDNEFCKILFRSKSYTIVKRSNSVYVCTIQFDIIVKSRVLLQNPIWLALYMVYNTIIDVWVNNQIFYLKKKLFYCIVNMNRT